MKDFARTCSMVWSDPNYRIIEDAGQFQLVLRYDGYINQDILMFRPIPKDREKYRNNFEGQTNEMFLLSQPEALPKIVDWFDGREWWTKGAEVSRADWPQKMATILRVFEDIEKRLPCWWPPDRTTVHLARLHCSTFETAKLFGCVRIPDDYWKRDAAFFNHLCGETTEVIYTMHRSVYGVAPKQNSKNLYCEKERVFKANNDAEAIKEFEDFSRGFVAGSLWTTSLANRAKYGSSCFDGHLVRTIKTFGYRPGMGSY